MAASLEGSALAAGRGEDDQYPFWGAPHQLMFLFVWKDVTANPDILSAGLTDMQ